MLGYLLDLLGLKKMLAQESFDVVFHAAAVSDYKVASVHTEDETLAVSQNIKISSTADTLQLTLIKQAKIIDRIVDWSVNKDVTVVGFKLTNTDDSTQQHQAANKLLSKPGIHAVVHNDLHDISERHHPFTLYVHDRDAFECADIKAVVNVLMTLWEMKQ